MNLQDQKDPHTRYEELRTQSKKMKKRILIVLLGSVIAILILAGVVALIEAITKKDVQIPEGDYEFYPVYTGDIMENEEYLGLDRQIYYCGDPSGYGLIETITEEKEADFDATVLFLCDYIQTIIDGDGDAYNACFNQNYFKEVEAKEDFSQQMLHQIQITYYSSELEKNGSKLVTYRLEYMIHRNDGTFRRDVGSDAKRPQYITLRVLPDGNISIEKLITIYSTTELKK